MSDSLFNEDKCRTHIFYWTHPEIEFTDTDYDPTKIFIMIHSATNGEPLFTSYFTCFSCFRAPVKGEPEKSYLVMLGLDVSIDTTYEKQACLLRDHILHIRKSLYPNRVPITLVIEKDSSPFPSRCEQIANTFYNVDVLRTESDNHSSPGVHSTADISKEMVVSIQHLLDNDLLRWSSRLFCAATSSKHQPYGIEKPIIRNLVFTTFEEMENLTKDDNGQLTGGISELPFALMQCVYWTECRKVDPVLNK